MRAAPKHSYAVGTGRIVKMLPSVEPVTEENWMLVASKAYDNPACTSFEEFMDDMKRFKYIRKLVTQYERGGELKERLILNHIILLGNVLGPETLVRILFLKMRTQLTIMMPFLVLLNVLPDAVRAIGRNCEDIRTDEIPLDPRVIAALRSSVR